MIYAANAVTNGAGNRSTIKDSLYGDDVNSTKIDINRYVFGNPQITTFTDEWTHEKRDSTLVINYFREYADYHMFDKLVIERAPGGVYRYTAIQGDQCRSVIRKKNKLHFIPAITGHLKLIKD